MTDSTRVDTRRLLGAAIVTMALLVAAESTRGDPQPGIVSHLLFALACYGGLAAALACGRVAVRPRGMWLGLAVGVSVGLDLVLVLTMPAGGEDSSLAAGRTALATAAVIAYLGVIGWPAAQSRPAYPAIFRLVSGMAVEMVIALVLSAFAWILLIVSVLMLRSVGLDLTGDRITNLLWSIAIPMTLAAFLIGLRQRAALADALRQQLLTLVGRLQPLVVLIAMTFLGAFAVRAADGQALGTVPASAVLGLACCWIVTLNATWQDDGNIAVFSPSWLRALRLSVLALPVLVALALGGLIVRIEAHGWTPVRIWVLVLTLSLLAVGLGYAWGAIRAARWQGWRAGTNVVVPLAAAATVVALSAPGVNVVRLAPAAYAPPHVIDPPGAMPALTALPPGFAPDLSLWEHVRAENPWSAKACIDAVAARDRGETPADCAMLDLGTWGGHRSLIAFWSQMDSPPYRVRVFGRRDGVWKEVADVSPDWLAATGRLPEHLLQRGVEASEAAPQEAAKPAAETE